MDTKILYHGFDLPVLDYKLLNVKTPGLDKILPGWLRGAIIAIVGPPKAGKTTFALYESMAQARDGKRVLYVYNESPPQRFMRIAKVRLHESFNDDKNIISNMKFLSLFGLQLMSARYDSIDKFAKLIVDNIVKYSANSDMIIIDSISKFAREFVPQMYYFVSRFTYYTWEYMKNTGREPVILAINQKSGDYWDITRPTVVGGHGVVHEFDGTITMYSDIVDKWMARDFKFVPGQRYHIIRCDAIRDLDVDSREYVVNMINGQIIINKPLEEYYRAIIPGDGK